MFMGSVVFFLLFILMVFCATVNGEKIIFRIMGYYESFFLIKYRGNTYTENYETKLGKGHRCCLFHSCPVSYQSDYLFYYVNIHGGPYFNQERIKICSHMNLYRKQFPVKRKNPTIWDHITGRPGAWVVTRRSDSPYFYIGDIQGGSPHGIGAVYRRDFEMNGEKPTDILLLKGEFSHGVPQGYVQLYCLCGGLEYMVCCRQYQIQEHTDWQSAVNAVMVHLTYEGYSRRGKPYGRGILYRQRSLKAIPHIIELIQNHEFSVHTILQSIKEVDFTVGTFHGGQLQGLGKEYVGGRLFFQGIFLSGEKFRGRTYDLDGHVKYEGFFKNGKYNGKGTLYHIDGSVEYTGIWKDGDYYW